MKSKRKVITESDEESTKKVKLDEEVGIQFPKEFNLTNFRTKIREGKDFITELRHFIHASEKNDAVPGQYLQKHGKPLELVGAIERIDTSNLFHCSYICKALELVLMEIITNRKELSDQGKNASKFFLKTHSLIVETLIKSPSFSHRKIVLKLLTAIVCLEPQLGRQILSNFDFLSEVKAVEQLLSHSTDEIRNDKSTDTVRKAFIHFILAYMVEGNILLLRNILDKGILVNALMNGLIFDDHLTVCVVLNTFSKFVLECPQISKTKKIQIFNLECTKSIVKLYNWLGPKGFIQKCIKNTNNFEGIINAEEKELVALTAHNFLVTLLSSRKLGIAFDALTNFKEKHNVIQQKIIYFIDKPWLSDQKLELISKILIACPELARNTVKHYGNLVNPFKTGHLSWCVVADFNRKLIELLHPKLMKSAFSKITLTEYCGWIKDICLPIEILTHLQGEKSLRSKSYEHRLVTIKLLFAMYKQYCNYMKAISKREKDHESDLRKFKLDVLDHILLNFPTIENVLMSLDLTIRAEDFEENEKSISVLRHLDITLELVILFCKNNKSFVNKTSGIIHFLDILRPLYTAECDEIEGLNKDFKLALELKAVKTILLLSPMSLSPDLDIFVNVFKSFINAFVYGSSLKIRHEAKCLLHGLFLNTCLFNENSKLEIDIWLEPLRYFDKKTVKVVTKVFLQSFQAPKDLFMDIGNKNDEISSNMNLKQLFENIENNLSVQGYVEHIEISKLLLTILKGVTIGDSLRKYLDVVCLLLYHYLPQNQIINEILKTDEKVYSTFHKYSKSWLKKSDIINPLTLIPHLEEINQQAIKGTLNSRNIFVKKNENEFIQIHLINESDPIDFSEEIFNHLVLYIFNCLSTANRLCDLETLQEHQSKALSNFIGDCFEFLIHMEERLENEIENSDRPTENILKYIYNNNVRVLQNFSLFPANESSKNYLIFIENLTRRLHCCPKLDLFTTLFRQKLVKEIKYAVVNNSVQKYDLFKVIDVFKLNVGECTDILESIGLLKYNQIVDKSNGSKTMFFDVLVLVLNRLSEMKTSVPTGKFEMKKIGNIYKQILSKVEVDNTFEKLEEALVNFLSVSHQLIEEFALNGEVFKNIFYHKRITKSTVKLAILLLERVTNLNLVFFEELSENLSKKELVYPLLDATVTSGHIKDLCSNQILTAVYQEFKNGFMKTIEKPQKAGVIYKENSNASIYILHQCMPSSECIDFTKKNLKIDQVEIFQIKIIDAIYMKAVQSGDIGSILTQYLQLLIQMSQIVLKKDSSEFTNLQKISKLSFLTFNLLENHSLENFDYQKILKSQNWSNFCKTILKQCIRICENKRDDDFSAEALKVLAYLFDKLYEDESENIDAGQYFEMIFSHSKFLEIVLSHSNEFSKVKGEVIHLLLTLAKKNKKALNENQIPILLGSYDAKLSRNDRYIIALLQFYEKSDVNVNKYRPFIWGESAIAFYSLKNEEAKANLTHQETSVGQVMSLIDFNTSDYTLRNFPVWRKLNTLKQLPNTVFINPEDDSFNFGSNGLEKLVENGNPIGVDLLKLCPKREAIFEECYDPAFIIPLMTMSFAPDVYSQPVRPVQNGLLSIVFASLSSLDKDMRLAAGCAQLRYRTHFESSKFFEKPIWSQGYDNIQSGLEDFKNAWIAKKKKNYGIPRVPYISGIFLSRTFNCLVDPTHQMYKPLSMYLRLKESFNFQCVPEFNVLFYSPEIEHQAHRKFILEIIRDGIKCSSDLFLLIANNIFKALMGYYNSTMSTLEINLLILSVMSTAVKIPATSKIMIEHVGVLSWLSSIVNRVQFYHYDTIEGIINILNNLWYAVKANATEFYNFRYIQTQIYRITVQLLPLLSNRVTLKSFGKYLNILLKTGNVANSLKTISAEHIDQLINCGQRHYEHDLWIIQNIRHFGANGVKPLNKFCGELAKTVDSKCEEECFKMLGLISLREIVVSWVNQSSC
ncbi:URB1 family protein [Megaselia abdita]